MINPTLFQINLHLFCQGDSLALGKLYKELLPELYLVAFSYMKSSQEAEDVVADCFEKLLKMPIEKRQQKFIENQINIRALMILIVKNKCLDNLKTNKNRVRIIDTIKNFLPFATSNLVNNKFANENFHALSECLQDKERMVLKLNIDGFSHQEISDQLNISEELEEYFEFYNKERFYQSLDYKMSSSLYYLAIVA